jgi:TonB family protein
MLNRTQISAVPALVEGLVQEAGEFPAVPSSVIRNDIRGTVFMDAALAPSGCVQRVTLVRGVDPALDVAAIDATATWRYRMPKFEGATPRVEVRVTTTFQP